MSKIRIVKNPDKEYAKKFTASLKSNSGYCPCRISKTPDTKCICKEFRDMISCGETGSCRCGFLIAKIKED